MKNNFSNTNSPRIAEVKVIQDADSSVNEQASGKQNTGGRASNDRYVYVSAVVRK